MGKHVLWKVTPQELWGTTWGLHSTVLQSPEGLCALHCTPTRRHVGILTAAASNKWNGAKMVTTLDTRITISLLGRWMCWSVKAAQAGPKGLWFCYISLRQQRWIPAHETRGDVGSLGTTAVVSQCQQHLCCPATLGSGEEPLRNMVARWRFMNSCQQLLGYKSHPLRR